MTAGTGTDEQTPGSLQPNCGAPPQTISVQCFNTCKEPQGKKVTPQKGWWSSASSLTKALSRTLPGTVTEVDAVAVHQLCPQTSRVPPACGLAEGSPLVALTQGVLLSLKPDLLPNESLLLLELPGAFFSQAYDLGQREEKHSCLRAPVYGWFVPCLTSCC